MNTEQKTKIAYTVVDSSAKSCGGWGNYRRVAVIKHDADFFPTRIDERPKAVHEIVWCSGKVFSGKTDNCAHGRAESYALSLCAELNAELDNLDE